MNFSENTKFSLKNILFLPCFQLYQTAMLRNFVLCETALEKIKNQNLFCVTVNVRFICVFVRSVRFYRICKFLTVAIQENFNKSVFYNAVAYPMPTETTPDCPTFTKKFRKSRIFFVNFGVLLVRAV